MVDLSWSSPTGSTPSLDLMTQPEQLLASTAISISQDAATSETGDWQESFLVAEHPTTATTDVRSARILVGLRCIAAGRLGGTTACHRTMGLERTAAGGDVGRIPAAADRRAAGRPGSGGRATDGQGNSRGLGADSCLVNEGLVKGYPFVGNLFAYLTHRRSGPQSPWRQALGLGCSLAVSFSC